MNDEQQSEAEFLQAVRAGLERDSQRLDAPTLARLKRIRRQAVEGGRGRRRFHLLAPFGGLVAACVVALALVVLDSGPGGGETVAPALPEEDIDLLISADLELYEDFEFYQWLAESGQASR